jgi:hypothetical protein
MGATMDGNEIDMRVFAKSAGTNMGFQMRTKAHFAHYEWETLSECDR